MCVCVCFLLGFPVARFRQLFLGNSQISLLGSSSMLAKDVKEVCFIKKFNLHS
jgi:hypothetical protein